MPLYSASVDSVPEQKKKEEVVVCAAPRTLATALLTGA
jgi:hypothetical protein